jgi:hypothetical protein
VNLDDTVRETYQVSLRDLDIPPGDASGARRAGSRIRTRRSVAAITQVGYGLYPAPKAAPNPAHPPCGPTAD